MNWLGEEDPELLRAALAIIEAWDGESSVNGIPVVSSPAATDETDSTNDENDNDADGASEDGGGEDAPASSGDNRAPKTAEVGQKNDTGKAPSRGVKGGTGELKQSTISSTRHKRREEIIYLRDKVKEMESQLATIQNDKLANGDAKGGVFSGAEQGVEAALAVMWQDIASRQQRLRQKAELEQAKLRGLLETQMKVARGLLKLMQKARRMEEDEAFPSPKRMKLPINVSLNVNEDDQCARIDQLYNATESAFTFAKFHDGSLKFVDIEVSDDQDGHVMIEFRDAWAVPFDIPQVMDAAWQYIVKKTEQKRCREQATMKLTVHGDKIVSHFTASANMGALKGQFDGKSIFKRFPATGDNGNDPAIVSTTFVEQSDASNSAFQGVQCHEDSWLRVRLALSASSSQQSGRPLALVQSVQRYRLTFDSETSAASVGRRQAGVLTDFLLDQLTQEIQFKHETVETLLLHTRTAAQS